MRHCPTNPSTRYARSSPTHLPARPEGLRHRRLTLVTDNFEVGSAGTHEVTAITFLVIAIMLLFVYRSLVTMLIVLVTVAVELSAARGVVALLAHSGVIGLSTYSTNLLTLLAIAAGTDYAIFVVGRYQEARSNGMDRISAYYDMWRGTVHVIVGSGLTIAGAVACMSFARLPYFQTLGIPRPSGGGDLGRRADVGPCGPADRNPLRVDGTQGTVARSGLAPDRHRDRALARTHPGGDVRPGTHRGVRPAQLSDEL